MKKRCVTGRITLLTAHLHTVADFRTRPRGPRIAGKAQCEPSYYTSISHSTRFTHLALSAWVKPAMMMKICNSNRTVPFAILHHELLGLMSPHALPRVEVAHRRTDTTNRKVSAEVQELHVCCVKLACQGFRNLP